MKKIPLNKLRKTTNKKLEKSINLFKKVKKKQSNG